MRHGMYIVYMHGKSRHVDGIVVTVALMNSKYALKEIYNMVKIRLPYMAHLNKTLVKVIIKG